MFLGIFTPYVAIEIVYHLQKVIRETVCMVLYNQSGVHVSRDTLTFDHFKIT